MIYAAEPYADLPLGIYFAGALFYLKQYLDDSVDLSNAFMSGLLAMISLYVKLEAMPFVSVLSGAFL
jgi:hypothetical protein